MADQSVVLMVAQKVDRWVDEKADLLAVQMVHWLVVLLADQMVAQTVGPKVEWKAVRMVAPTADQWVDKKAAKKVD